MFKNLLRWLLFSTKLGGGICRILESGDLVIVEAEEVNETLVRATA